MAGTKKRNKNHKSLIAENRFKKGDSVRIRECAPVSKSKTFEVVYDDVAKV